MVTLAEIEAQAMNLTDSERATLASRLLHSLSSELGDDDDGLAEALRREAEMDADPSMSISLEELKRSVGR
ncbi:MAG: addiction module protein [Verrucomicrobiota bacterium]